LDGISVIHKKPIKINIQDKNKLDFIGRQTQIDIYNTTAPGNIVKNELVTQYNNRLPSLQRETVFEALKHLDGTRFSQLEEYGKKN
jgi:hypothetical protein